ncbi:MAG: serine/threonine protein kinase [Rubrivivax sp.]|nr:MAG: serine/threonine protein kinase [Rubrivivax sp.]
MDYDIEGLLGVGGFGLVYRAREAALQRAVAIKEYLPSSLALRGDGATVVVRSPNQADPFALGLKSFVNEARLLARFDHPSLVKVYRFWEAHGTAYMVMPCYEGPTLYDARRAMSGPPDEAWLRALMEPLLGALDCLHREQVFHRDVAPDNILVVADPDAPHGIRPVLLDFGAARRVISQNTQALTAILKPSFAPIEQYAETTQLRQGPWTDLYGLAAVLHYCITGRTPVPATARAVYDDLPSLLQMAPALAQDFGRSYSPALLATIDRALSVKPEERPASATAWREMLQQPVVAPLLRVPVVEPGAADPQPATKPQREVWNERTIMVTPVGQQQRDEDASADHYTTTQSLSAAHRVIQPLGASAATGHRPWPRGLAWGGGAVVMAAIVALSSWTVSRQPGLALPPGDIVASADPPATAVASIRTPVTASSPVALPSAQPDPFSLGGTVLGSASEADHNEPAEEVLSDSTDTSRDLATAAPAAARATTGRPPDETEFRRSRSQRAVTDTDEAARVVRTARSSPEPLNPRRACGDRMFIAMAICMKRYCGQAPYARHSECARMRRQEEAQRPSFP